MKDLTIAILATILGGVFLAYALPLLPKLSGNPDALSLEISAGPWAPFPASEADVLKEWKKDGFSDALIEEIETGGTWHIARMVVRNSGSQTASNIRINLADLQPETTLIQEAGKPLAVHKRPRELVFGNLAPGQTATVFLWSAANLSSDYYYTDWKTYSSVGPMKLVFDRGTKQITFWDTAFVPMLIIIGFTVLFDIGAIISASEKYYKKLLADEAFWHRERTRFSGDPKKFVPDYDGKSSV